MNSIRRFLSGNSSLDVISVMVLVTMSSFIIYTVFVFLGYGFDFTDESFYIHWVSNPFLYRDSITHFGYIYHPIYLLFNGDIVALRRANIAFTLGLSFLNAFVVIKHHFQKNEKFLVLSASIALSTISFTYLQSWIGFPSYNSLCFQAILIVSLGILIQYLHEKIHFWIPSTIVGLGLWALFMAKPTSFVFMSFLCIIVLATLPKDRIKIFITTLIVFASSMLVSSILFAGSPVHFLNRISTSLRYTSLLEPGRNIGNLARLDPLTLSFDQLYLLFTLTIFFTVGLFLLRRRFFIFVGHSSILIFGTGICFLLACQINLGNTAIFSNLYYLYFVLAHLLISAIALVRPSGWSKRDILISWILGLCPFAFSFGTNNNLWQFSNSASFFSVLAISFLIVRSPLWVGRATGLKFTFAVAQFFMVVVLIKSISSPYRQFESFFISENKARIGKSGSEIIVSSDFENYISSLQASVKNYNMHTEGVIDLTGHYPGVSYIIGAVAPGRPWLMGGYPGSYNVALAAFQDMNCTELGSAWLLFEPDGPYGISPEILFSHGLSLDRDYELVAQITSPISELSGKFEHLFYKPKNSEANIHSCLESRKSM